MAKMGTLKLGVAMTTRFATALLAAAAMIAAAYAETETMKDGPMQGLERLSERGAERLLRRYDINHDGKIPRAEMYGVIGARFAAATRRAAEMSIEQFVAARAAEYRPSNEAMFQRLDWNGDSKLTLAEYTAPQHIRFVGLDPKGKGFIFCGYDPAQRGGRGGLAGFCRENDLDMDGRVTRAELDQALTKRFSTGAGKGQTMTKTQFVQSEEQRYLPVNVRQFHRLDQDGGGTLTIQEYAAAEITLFARLDKNGNKVLEPAELRPKQTRLARSDNRSAF